MPLTLGAKPVAAQSLPAVLNEVQAHSPGAEVRYWRQRRGPEVDFVMIFGWNINVVQK